MQYLLPALVLGLAASIVELRGVYSTRMLRNLIARFPLLGLVMSVVVTALLSALFGAPGLVMMIGGSMAIVFTGIVYRIDRIIQAFRKKDDENVAA